MAEVVAATLSAARFTGMLLGVFAALALILSAVGINGCFPTRQPQHERDRHSRRDWCGPQASPEARVDRGRGLALTGVVIGLIIAAAVTRLMRRCFTASRPEIR